MPPRIDAHVHAFPDRLAIAVRAALSGMGGLDADPLLPGVAARVASEGFAAAWILPYAHRAGVAAGVNEWAAQEVTRHAHLVAGATFHPADEDLPALVSRALGELRLRVVKLHCSVGAFSPLDSRLAPLWECASEHRVPVVIHAGQVHGGNAEPGEVAELEPVLVRHPGLKVILAHTGHPATRVALDLIGTFHNLFGDLTPVGLSSVDVEPADLERFAGRFLFGSDAPNNPAAPALQLRRYCEMGLTPAAFEALAGGTAASLIPLQHGEA